MAGDIQRGTSSVTPIQKLEAANAFRRGSDTASNLINASTLPRLMHTVLEYAAARDKALPRDFDASQAYAAGLCGVFGLIALEMDEAEGLAYVALTRAGYTALRRFRAGRAFREVIDFSKLVATKPISRNRKVSK
jgi:hypothetical protein